jgi:hypothetical protein
LALLAFSLAEVADAAPRARPDFNGDGFADLAIGVPGEDIGPHVNTGIVHIVYGSNGGLAPPAFVFSAAHCTYWPPNGNVSGNAAGLRFGETLAWGDFNADGVDDLAVGMPSYSPPYQPSGMAEAGMVYVIYGSRERRRLMPEQTQVLVSTNIGGAPLFLNINQNAGDRFGAALAAADFNGDLVDDLAIGAPGQSLDGSGGGQGSAWESGEVYVVYGTRVPLGFEKPGGLNRSNAVALTQQTVPHPAWIELVGEPNDGDHFGAALAAGDFSGDHIADLAIGVPGEIGNAGASGAVSIAYGSMGAGLRALGNHVFRQGEGGILGVAEAGERMGFALVSGDFNGDTIMDLAIGAPRATIAGGAAMAGEVNVIYGQGGGLAPFAGPGNQLWHQNVPLILDDGLLGGEMFGFALAAGDFNGDTRADLAVGAPYDSPDAVVSAGAVNIILGSGVAGLTSAGNQYWHQNSPGIADANGPHNQFGRSLIAANFGANAADDLAIGVPNETVGGLIGAGAVSVIYGQPVLGLNAAGDHFIHQGVAGEIPEVDDGFGNLRSPR